MNYRDNEYFNNKDFFLFKIHNGKYEDEVFISRVHLYNGSYYTNTPMQYKCTSLKSVNTIHF